MSRFDAFSPEDLELLVADLLTAEGGGRYEPFTRGVDGGVDLRRFTPAGLPDVVQVKHYERSGFASLKAKLPKELESLGKLEPRPARYRLATSCRLTRRNKDEAVAALSPHLRRADDVLGHEDLLQLLGAHPEVERRHPKLWLTGSTQLSELVHADVRHRSDGLLRDIEASLGTFVRHSRFEEAQERLQDGRVLIIAGDPGVGKTTLARLLVADSLKEGFDEPIAVSGRIAEARKVIDASRRQVIVFDDFLGRTALERMEKNEDRELTQLIRQVLASDRTRFVLTTREYILRHAADLHEELRHAGVEQRRYLLEMGAYSLEDRGRIFLNHSYASRALPPAAVRSMLPDDGFLRVLRHRNYNPRTVAYMTGTEGPVLRIDEPERYLEQVLAALEDPSRIWRQTFTQELNDTGRALALATAACGRQVTHDDLLALFDELAPRLGAASGQEGFDSALASLDDSLLRTWQGAGEIFVALRDPSVEDYLTKHLRGHRANVGALLESATAFESVEWLLERAHGRKQAAVEVVAEAVRRTLWAMPISWEEIHYSDSPGSFIRRRPLNMASRMRRLAERMRADRELADALGQWWTDQLDRLLDEPGAVGANHHEELTRLVLMRRHDVQSLDRGPERALEILSRELGWGVHWRALISLLDGWPGLVEEDDERWEQLVDQCAGWTERSLEEWSELQDPSELDAIESAAATFGVDLEPELLEQARDHLSAQDADDYEPPGPEQATAESDEEVDRARAGFQRLADEMDD